MPLINSSSKPAFVSNLKQELKTKPRAQALAISYAVKRRARAEGGGVFEGPIVSSVPGRTDHHPMDVAAGSYVLPADHVSSLGEGNTLAGMDYLKKIGADGIRKLIAKMGVRAPLVRARGGKADHSGAGQPVPIAAAGGEHIMTPQEVATVGGGDLKKGHALLDAWVVANRKKHIKTLKRLPGPAQD